MWKRYLVTNSEYLWLAAGEIIERRGPALSFPPLRGLANALP